MTNGGERVVGPPVFIPQDTPELKEFDRKAIHEFLRPRERSERRVQGGRAQGTTLQVVTIVASVAFDLLTSLIDLETLRPWYRRAE